MLEQVGDTKVSWAAIISQTRQAMDQEERVTGTIMLTVIVSATLCYDCC